MTDKQQLVDSEANEIQLQLWTLIGNIPSGKVTTYGRLAALAGAPNYARYVGTLLKKLPEDTQLPWHRVVNASGKISFPTGSHAYNTQYQRLLDEGIVFSAGKIALTTYAWRP